MTRPLARLLRTAGWHRARRGTLRHRAFALVADRHPWYDWGHRLMTITGQERTGSYEPPRGRDLWYLPDTLRTSKRNPVVTYDYADVLAYPEGDWKILDAQDEGDRVVLGWWPHEGGDGRIHAAALEGAEIDLLRRWLVVECWIRGDWCGIRRRLYYAGLHAHVHLRKPFACNAVPPRGTGGYSHWHCELRRRHTTDHRFRSYTWPLIGGTTRYEPQEAHR